MAGLEPEEELILTVKGQATSVSRHTLNPSRTGPEIPPTDPKNYPQEACLCTGRNGLALLEEKTVKVLSLGK